jgi:hypothetical protein
MNPDRVVTERMTYGLGEMLGEIGGLFKMLDLWFCLCIGFFAPQRLFPYLARALYRDDPYEGENIKKFLSTTTFENEAKF